ncbi:hypothetical protein GCM10009616_29940 [Microlunatus lacustris]
MQDDDVTTPPLPPAARHLSPDTVVGQAEAAQLAPQRDAVLRPDQPGHLPHSHPAILRRPGTPRPGQEKSVDNPAPLADLSEGAGALAPVASDKSAPSRPQNPTR